MSECEPLSRPTWVLGVILCCPFSSVLYPGGLRLKSRSLTIALNSFLLGNQ